MSVIMGDSSSPNYNNGNTMSATGSFVMNPPTTGQIALIVATNAITITFGAPTNILEGASYKIIVKAGDASARTYAWNSAYKFPNATPPVTAGTQVTGAYDMISFVGGASNTLYYDGSNTSVR
jgi:hypothetical protein